MPPTETTVRQYGGYRHIASPNRPTSDPLDVVRWWRELTTEKALFVYFIQHGEGGPVKIGKAYDPKSRLRELQCGNPRTLVIRAVVLSGDSTEERLHGRWWKYRIRGEWFGNWVRPAGKLDRYGMGGKVTVQPVDHPNIAETIISQAREAQAQQVKSTVAGTLSVPRYPDTGELRPAGSEHEEYEALERIALQTIKPPDIWPAYETWPQVPQ